MSNSNPFLTFAHILTEFPYLLFEYIISAINTDDDELNSFLFSLGCYSGEPITVIAQRKGGYTVSIKNGRYNIDSQLAAAIQI